MPFFSIIIPVYNVGPYLRECLDSVFSQQFRDFEVCIVDDGSTDDSGRICDEYKTRYNSSVAVKLVHQSNHGVSVARNRALDMAEGEYIWFVDSDDYVEPEALGYIASVIADSGCDTLFFGTDLKPTKVPVEYDLYEKKKFLKEHICYCNPLMIFKRGIIEENHLRFTVGMKMGEDLEFQYKYLIHCALPCAIPYNFYHIRLREGSASRNGQNSMEVNFIDCRIFLRNFAEYLRRMDGCDYSWIESRISGRLKCYLHTCVNKPNIGFSELNQEFRLFIKNFKEVGLSLLNRGSLRIALIDIRLYIFVYKLTMMFRNLRK